MSLIINYFYFIGETPNKAMHSNMAPVFLLQEIYFGWKSKVYDFYCNTFSMRRDDKYK